MNFLIKKIKLSLFFIILFLFFFFLFDLSGMSETNQPLGVISSHMDWMYSLNQGISSLAKKSGSLRVDQLFQQDNLLAINLTGYQDYQGSEIPIEKIMVIDLLTKETVYEKIFYDNKIMIGLYANYLIYDQKTSGKSGGSIIKIIDLKKQNSEREVEGEIFQITSNGYIFSRYPGNIIHIDKAKNIFSHEFLKGYSALLTTNGFFMKKKNEKGNWDGYQFLNYQGKPIFAIQEYSKAILPNNDSNSTLSFPIPILKEKVNQENELQLIDADGEMISSYPLSELGILGTAFGREGRPYGSLTIIAKNELNYLLDIEVYDQESKRKDYYVWIDREGKKIALLEDHDRVIAQFDSQGHLIVLAESDEDIFHFTLKYYNVQGECILEKYLPPNIESWPGLYQIDSENILLYDNHSTFFKYSLINGQLTGLYPFPSDYRVQLATVFNNQTYILTGQPWKSRSTELEGNHLVSFSLENSGWFDLELVKLSPLADEPFSVYEDSEIEVRFEASQSYSLPEDQLEVSFEKGEILHHDTGKQGRWDYLWHSPGLVQEEQETVNITASYGPISKTYQVKVKALKNPLIMTGQLTVDSRNQGQLILEGQIENTANIEIKNLEWQWTLDNLSLISSSFLDSVSALKEESFKMRFNRLAINDGKLDRIDWNGYDIPQQVQLICDYPEGRAEKIFEHSLNIQPEYFITLKLYDPLSRLNWSWKDLKELDLSNLKVWDELGNDITSSLQVEKLSGNLIKINGLAAGIEEKPVKIGVNYNGEIQWYELKFQSDKQPRFPKLVVNSFQFDLIASFPFPPPNGESIPFPRNPHIASGSTYRGACGAGRPDTAISLSDIQIRVPDPVNNSNHYLLNYSRVDECGTHAGCRWHDACFDECAKNYGEEDFYEPCHMYCNERVAVDMYGPDWGYSWQDGGGPYDGYFIYSDPPTWEGPFSCSVYDFPTANYRIDLNAYFFNSAKTKVNGFITLYGTDGTVSSETLLDNYSEGESNNGNPDTFYVNMKNINDIKRIKLRHENKGSGQEWYVGTVRIVNLDTGKVWHFMVNKLLAKSEESEGINQEFPLAYREEADYMIVVYTGDVDWELGEGTDADIYISLIGENGTRTGELFLDYPYQNNFETGDCDIFDYIRTGEIGELDHIVLRHDGSGIGPDWYCEKVDIYNRTSGKAWHISVKKWLTDENTPKTFFPE